MIQPVFSVKFPVLTFWILLVFMTDPLNMHAYAYSGVTSIEQKTDQRLNKIYVVKKDLRKLISDYAKRKNIKFKMTVNVKGTVSKTWLPIGKAGFLEDLSRKHGLEWYADGEVIHISHTDENAARIIPLDRVSISTLKDKLKEVQLSSQRFPIRHSKGSNFIIVTAPISYLARIELILENLKYKVGGVNMIKYGHRQGVSVRP